MSTSGVDETTLQESETVEESGSNSGQDQENGGKPLTMEERKAKLAQLRQKFVSIINYCLRLPTRTKSRLFAC